MKVLVFLAVLAGFGYWLYEDSRPRFNDKLIAAMQEGIRDFYGKQEGYRVVDVSLMRESERKLIGFAKIKIEGVPGEQNVNCTATMSDTDGRSMWSCR